MSRNLRRDVDERSGPDPRLKRKVLSIMTLFICPTSFCVECSLTFIGFFFSSADRRFLFFCRGSVSDSSKGMCCEKCIVFNFPSGCPWAKSTWGTILQITAAECTEAILWDLIVICNCETKFFSNFLSSPFRDDRHNDSSGQRRAYCKTLTV